MSEIIYYGKLSTVPRFKTDEVRVWCLECGNTQKVDRLLCLSCGWPKCCGYTMTIDPPKEQGE